MESAGSTTVAKVERWHSGRAAMFSMVAFALNGLNGLNEIVHRTVRRQITQAPLYSGYYGVDSVVAVPSH